jgi:quinohemoprotein ethanol dehydrogenase
MTSSMLNRLRFAIIAGAVLAGTLNAAASTDRDPGQWLSAGQDESGTYHSPLSDINASNVSKLGFAWEYKLRTHRGLEATPVMVDGVLYTSGNFGTVYALDAATGRERWVYDPGVDGQYGRYACCDAVNRGVAVSNGRVYVAALDGYLHAIDAATGKRVWKVDSLPLRSSKAPYTVTGAPVIAGHLILIGAGGGDFRGVRGYVAAFDARTGKLQWRFYTVPRNPSQGAQDQPHLVNAVKTWDVRHRWEEGGGGPVWDGISYDPDSKLIYIGTGNAAPYDIKEDGRGGGDNLYTACIVALRETGQLAWYYHPENDPGRFHREWEAAEGFDAGIQEWFLLCVGSHHWRVDLCQAVRFRELDPGYRCEIRPAHPEFERGLRTGPENDFPLGRRRA